MDENLSQRSFTVHFLDFSALALVLKAGRAIVPGRDCFWSQSYHKDVSGILSDVVAALEGRASCGCCLL